MNRTYVGTGFHLRRGYRGQVSRPASNRRTHGPARAGRYVLVLCVAVAACTEKPPDIVLRASGNVEATDVQLAPEVGGRLIELRVSEGDRVNAGDVIARVDTRDTELQIQRLRAERAGADAQLRLLRAGSRSEDVRQAEAQVRAAEADITTVAAELTAAQLDL